MKKSISIFCALTLLFSVFAVCLCTPASAESVKYVEAENFTLPNGITTNLKAFTFEDFEYENTDALSESYIKRYVDSTVDSSKATASIESDKLKGKSLALVNNGANYEIYRNHTSTLCVNPLSRETFGHIVWQDCNPARLRASESHTWGSLRGHRRRKNL